MNTIQAGYTPATASLNASASSAQDTKDKIGNWLAETGGKMAIDAIKGMDVPQSWKDKAIGAIEGRIGIPAGEMPGEFLNPIRNPPVSGTPAQEGNLARELDGLKDGIKKFFEEALALIAEGGSAEGSKKEKSKEAAKGGAGVAAPEIAGDFFTAFATAIGTALQEQANSVEKISDTLTKTVTDHVKDVGDKLKATGSEGLDQKGVQEKDLADKGIMLQQTLLSAEGMKLNFLSTGLQSALKSVSDSLNTMGRG